MFRRIKIHFNRVAKVSGLQRNRHHVFRIMYHFVWIPKYRHKIFEELHRSVVTSITEKIAYDHNIDIVELALPRDHIHMVTRSEPKVSPRSVMWIIKSISVREFFKMYPDIKMGYFEG